MLESFVAGNSFRVVCKLLRDKASAANNLGFVEDSLFKCGQVKGYHEGLYAAANTLAELPKELNKRE